MEQYEHVEKLITHNANHSHNSEEYLKLTNILRHLIPKTYVCPIFCPIWISSSS